MAKEPTKIPVSYQVIVRNSGGKVSLIVSAYEVNSQRYEEIWRGSANEPPKQLAHIVPRGKSYQETHVVKITYDVNYLSNSLVQIRARNNAVFIGRQDDFPSLLGHLNHYIGAAA